MIKLFQLPYTLNPNRELGVGSWELDVGAHEYIYKCTINHFKIPIPLLSLTQNSSVLLQDYINITYFQFPCCYYWLTMTGKIGSSNSGAVTRTAYLIYGGLQPAKATKLKHLTEACLAINIPAICFDKAAYLIEGYTDSIRFKTMRVLTPFSVDPHQLEQVFSLGIRNNLIRDIPSLNVTTFYNFCEWLKSSAGTKAIRQMRLRNKLVTRVIKHGFTSLQVRYTQPYIPSYSP